MTNAKIDGTIVSKEHTSVYDRISVKIEGPRDRVNELFSHILEKYEETLTD